MHISVWEGNQVDCRKYIGNNTYSSNEFNAALILAAYKSNTNILLYLLDKCNVNDSYLNGLTPLHAAVLNGDRETINILKNAGANVNAKDDKGRTPMMTACISSNEYLRNILQK